jgi:hypothetical protein
MFSWLPLVLLLLLVALLAAVATVVHLAPVLRVVGVVMMGRAQEIAPKRSGAIGGRGGGSAGAVAERGGWRGGGGRGRQGGGAGVLHLLLAVHGRGVAALRAFFALLPLGAAVLEPDLKEKK